MAKFKKPKFNIGDVMKFKGDSDFEKGEVLKYSYTPKEGWSYVISAKEVDIEKKEIIKGVKTCLEDELISVEKGGKK